MDTSSHRRFKVFLRCEHAERLLSDATERKLCRAEIWRLRLHLAYCRACRRVRRQLDFLRRAAHQLNDQLETGDWSVPGLSDEARARIKRSLEHAD